MEILRFVRTQWDRALGFGALSLGLLALLLGYLGVSGTPHVAAQLPYFISGGLVGIFLLGLGCMAWISADLRDEWRELHALRQLLERDPRLAVPDRDDKRLAEGAGHVDTRQVEADSPADGGIGAMSPLEVGAPSKPNGRGSRRPREPQGSGAEK